MGARSCSKKPCTASSCRTTQGGSRRCAKRRLAWSRRARGLELAQGDDIYCLDATYRSLSTTLQRLSNALEAHPQAMVAYGATVAVGNRGAAEQQTNLDIGSLDVLARLAAGDFFNSGAVAFRRAALAD